MAEMQTKRKVGRPSKYDPSILPQVQELAQNGLTDVEMAEQLGVPLRSYQSWRYRYPEFRRCADLQFEGATGRVVRALFQRAVGFWMDEQQIKVINGVVRRIEVRRYYPPDVGAIEWWLKHRDPKNWPDTQRVEHAGNVSVEHDDRSLAISIMNVLMDAERKAKTIEGEAIAEASVTGTAIIHTSENGERRNVSAAEFYKSADTEANELRRRRFRTVEATVPTG